MKKIFLTSVLTLSLITIGWLVAFAITGNEQTALDDLLTNFTTAVPGLPSDWDVTNIPGACTNATTPNPSGDWTGLTCSNIDNTVTGINLSSLGLVGEIPTSFTGFTNIVAPNEINISDNGLYTTSPTVDSFITGIQPNWKTTQVAPATSLVADPISDSTVVLGWEDGGYGTNLSSGPTYLVYRTQTPGTGYTLEGSTTSKFLAVSGLFPDTAYYFIVNTTGTNASGTLTSDPSAEVSATTLPLDSLSGGGGSDGGSTVKEACYIATAAYGSYLDPHVQALRDFRDGVLLKSTTGRELVDLYYRTSPPVAEFISRHETLRTITRVALTPVVYGVAYPGLGFAMIFGTGAMGALWWRRRRNNTIEKP